MPSQDHRERNRRRRLKAIRRRTLLRQLVLQAEIAFESSSDAGRTAALHRVLLTLLELINAPLNDEKRKAFMQLLKACSYSNEIGYDLSLDWDEEFDRDMLSITGSVNMRDLAGKMIWALHAPETLEGKDVEVSNS